MIIEPGSVLDPAGYATASDIAAAVAASDAGHSRKGLQ
jgi:hypothetical protein